MLSNHLFLCLLLLLPLIFPRIRVFSNESALYIRWPKYWSFSISPSNEYSGLISFGIDWFDLLAVQGTLKSLLQQHNLKASILPHSASFVTQKLHSAKLWKVTHKAVLCQVACKSKWLEVTQMLVGRGLIHGTSVHGMGGSSKQTRMLLKPHMRTTRWRKEGRTHISKWVQITWVPLSRDCPGQNSPVMGRLCSQMSVHSALRHVLLTAAAPVFRLQYILSLVCLWKQDLWRWITCFYSPESHSSRFPDFYWDSKCPSAACH